MENACWSIYKRLFMVLDSSKADFQHAISTRIGINLDEFRNLRVFFTLIPMVHIFLNIFFPWGTLPIYKIEENFVDLTAQVVYSRLQISAYGYISMQNHMTKTVFRNSKILHFFGVKSEFYHDSADNARIRRDKTGRKVCRIKVNVYSEFDLISASKKIFHFKNEAPPAG